LSDGGGSAAADAVGGNDELAVQVPHREASYNRAGLPIVF